ncbi:hypothetical protein XI06_22930 [Bradyrhizobium sp. CCBAU 11434]|uniref:phage tail tape measure protein n=1 Tax=Bradyrhizobium sp. CCBAU 11434 TaxID=1630885 RepID=UPI0023057F39|nr:phage tail tape measure protein [Bradyrhizobium sp. CCBAU 11434]MDA9523054.1 hypothetical protein [Bradyrhizobium sp. CCBAU 11434]
MSNPSVTATISANDLASPKLRELITTLKQAEKVAKEAFSGDGIGGKYTNSINQATLAAQKHVGVLHQMHAAHKAIAATVAGYASLKMAHVGVDTVRSALPYLREDRAIQARTGYSDSDMASLRKQQNELAAKLGANVEATQRAHETFGRLKYDAATNIAITGPTAIGARAMGVTAEQNAELMESMISQYGVHFESPADAQRKAKHLNDIAAVATKKSNMKFEDVLDYTRYSAAAASAVNVSPEQSVAMGMALRRGGIVGSEAGVFARQFYARMMAPTRKGREIAAQYGINLDEYAGHGTMSGEGLSDKLARTFGKGFSSKAIAAINKDLEEHGDEILSDRGKFAEAVVKARAADGEKLSETDRKHLVKSANEYYDWTKTGIRGSDLLDRFMAVNNPMLMQGYLGDKQGARGVALLKERDKYYEAKSDMAHVDGFSQKVSDEMSKGLAASVDRLTASFDALESTLVKASEGWLTPLVDGAGKVVGAFNELSPSMQAFAGHFAALSTAAAGLTAGGLFVQMLTGFRSLTVSAGEASVALQRLAGSAAVGSVAGASGVGGLLGKASKAIGVLGPLGLTAWGVYEAIDLMQSLPRSSANANPRMGGGRHSGVTPGWATTDVPWDLTNPNNANPRTGGGHRILEAAPVPYAGSSRTFGEGQSAGWQDSIMPIGKSGGFKDVAVTGTVTGEAELHNNIQIEVKPTAYFESLVKRMEAVANMHLNGQLGTSLQGPGDNSVKPTQGPPTGAQE